MTRVVAHIVALSMWTNSAFKEKRETLVDDFSLPFLFDPSSCWSISVDGNPF